MWLKALMVNVVLWAISFTYFVYAVFAAILLGHWKALAIAAIVFLLMTLAGIVLAALAE